jgi:hypothetical protein
MPGWGPRPGWSEAEPQDRQAEEFESPLSGRWQFDYKTPVVMIRLSTASRALPISLRRVPGVPLRFTPGFMLSPAPQAGLSG